MVEADRNVFSEIIKRNLFEILFYFMFTFDIFQPINKNKARSGGRRDLM